MKSRAVLLVFLATGLLCAQPAATLSDAERKDLQAALAETSNSPSEIARTLERHLKKYPDSPQRAEMERAIAKSAIEANDSARIVTWGERVLSTDMEQPLILERVADELLRKSEDKAAAERALKYAKKFEEILRALEKEGPSSKRNRGQMLDELDRALGRALLLQARASDALGKQQDALLLATRSWDTYPAAGTARELARLHERAGRNLEAVRHYADAFTAADTKSTGDDRRSDRARMAQLYRKEKGSEAGLGDLILESYDRSLEIADSRMDLARKRDPNAKITDPMDYTLSAVEGSPLSLKTLRGKVVVMDFWATWCGPCRTQHPLYEQVKQRFKGREDVVFLAINTDEDPSVVKPFLEQLGWSKNVYFEDGLSSLLRVSSIPTTVVIGKDGQIFSRMNGFVPDKFVDQLSGVIKEASGS